MKNLTWQNPEQLFVAQELINKVKSKCCGIKVKYDSIDARGTLFPIFRSLIWSIIWFSYLCFSEKVESVIPPEYRKLCSFDHTIITIVICLPLMIYVIGFSSLFNDVHKIQEEEIMQSIRSTPLAEDEYTDGRVIFKSPTDFSCEMNENEELGMSYFTMNYIYGNSNITLCSDYDNNKKKSNFENYCNSWEDAEAKEYPSQVLISEQRNVNNYPYWYKLTSYNIDETTVYWHFILLFDNNSNKVCLFSAYNSEIEFDTGTDEYIVELLNSIRF